MAMEMINELCGDDQEKWNDVKQVAASSLKSRIKLWDGIEQSIKNRQLEAAIR
jgi:hypothetical protein